MSLQRLSNEGESLSDSSISDFGKLFILPLSSCQNSWANHRENVPWFVIRVERFHNFHDGLLV